MKCASFPLEMLVLESFLRVASQLLLSSGVYTCSLRVSQKCGGNLRTDFVAHPLGSFLRFFFPLTICHVGSLNLGPMTPLSAKTSTPLTLMLIWKCSRGGKKMWFSHVLSFFQRLCSFLFLPAFGWSPVFLNCWFLIYCPEFIIVIVRRLRMIQVFRHIQQQNPSSLF